MYACTENKVHHISIAVVVTVTGPGLGRGWPRAGAGPGWGRGRGRARAGPEKGVSPNISCLQKSYVSKRVCLQKELFIRWNFYKLERL